MSAVDVLFWIVAPAGVYAGWRVFRTDSMVRAAYWLMAAFVAVGIVLAMLDATFLGLVLILMMAGEMTIMAVFMVAFMMNPAGLNPMRMVHQHGLAIAAGWVAFLGLGAVAVLGQFPDRPAPSRPFTAELGFELLGDSMLVFETAGITLLATMIGAVALASRKGRFGPADEGSEPPGGIEPVEEDGDGGHEGHGAGDGGDDHGGHADGHADGQAEGHADGHADGDGHGGHG